MSKLIDKFLCLSPNDRDWVVRRLSLGQRHRLGLMLGKGQCAPVAEMEESIEPGSVWRTEEISRFDDCRIMQALDDMPYGYLQILLHYEGESARDYFVRKSKKRGLVSRVLSSDIVDIPEQYGVVAAEFFLSTLRESV